MMLGILSAMILSRVLTAEIGKQALVLRRGDIDIQGCMRPSMKDPKVCFWGMEKRPGCAGECGDAVLLDHPTVEFACNYRVSGTVVDAEKGKPKNSFLIDFIVAGHARYRTRTAPNGRFLIEVDSRNPSIPCRESKDFGRMSVEADTGKIVLLGSFSKQFRSKNPRLKFGYKKAADFASENVDLAP